MADRLTLESAKTAEPMSATIQAPATGTSSERYVQTALRLALVPLALVLLWLLLHLLYGKAVASPWGSAQAVMTGIEQGWFTEAGLETLTAALSAAVIAAVLGIALGMTIGMSRLATEILQPLLGIAYSLPKIIFYPFVMLLMGLGTLSNAAFGVVSALLPVVMVVIGACATIPPIYLMVSRVYQLSPLQRFVSVVLPTTLPSLVVAARYGFSLAFLGVTMAELFGGGAGLGQELKRAFETHDLDRLYGITATLFIAGLAGNSFYLLLEGWLARRLGSPAVHD